MHSCELITTLCAKKVLCHHAEVAKDVLQYRYVFCNVIGGWKILGRKQSTLMKPEEWPDVTRPSLLRWGLGTRLEHIVILHYFVFEHCN